MGRQIEETHARVARLRENEASWLFKGLMGVLTSDKNIEPDCMPTIGRESIDWCMRRSTRRMKAAVDV